MDERHRQQRGYLHPTPAEREKQAVAEQEKFVKEFRPKEYAFTVYMDRLTKAFKPVVGKLLGTHGIGLSCLLAQEYANTADDIHQERIYKQFEPKPNLSFEDFSHEILRYYDGVGTVHGQWARIDHEFSAMRRFRPDNVSWQGCDVFWLGWLTYVAGAAFLPEYEKLFLKYVYEIGSYYDQFLKDPCAEVAGAMANQINLTLPRLLSFR